MNRLLMFLVLTCTSQVIYAQYVYTIKADSVKVTNSCDTAELIIENHTQNVPGFLYNKGKGRTEFRQAVVKLNDSTYIIGADTVYMPQLRAYNGTSLSNGNMVLGNDSGSVSAKLISTREIPLNGHNIVLTGNGKLGVGTKAPRDLIEIATPVAGDTSANLRFTYLNEPTRYSNVIWNKFSGESRWHYMGFTLTTGGKSFTPLVLGGDSTIYLNGHTKYAGDIGVNLREDKYPRGKVELVHWGNGTDVNMIVMGLSDNTHFHTIKTSFHGASSSENKMQFYVSRSQYEQTQEFGQANPLNLLGDGNAIFNGNIGVQKTFPSAHIHVGAGTSAGGTAPIKLTAGTVLTTPEDGAIEFDGTDLYITENGTRHKMLKTLTGQLTTNFGGSSLSAFNSVTTTLTVAGAQPGDIVDVSANTGAVNPPSIIVTAYVTSASTVTLQAYNASNSVVAIASDTYKVRVIR